MSARLTRTSLKLFRGMQYFDEGAVQYGRSTDDARALEPLVSDHWFFQSRQLGRIYEVLHWLLRLRRMSALQASVSSSVRYLCT